jgi:antitoxin component YwqK of YwqJK toxin-antitoxin module
MNKRTESKGSIAEKQNQLKSYKD